MLVKAIKIISQENPYNTTDCVQSKHVVTHFCQ